MRTDVLNQLRKFDDRQMVLLVKDVNRQFQCLVVIADVSVGEGKMRRNNGIIRTDIALDGLCTQLVLSLDGLALNI